MSSNVDNTLRKDISETESSTNSYNISLGKSDSNSVHSGFGSVSPGVEITHKTDKVNTIYSDDKEKKIKSEMVQFELLSTTDDSSMEDIPKTYENSTNQRHETKDAAIISSDDKRKVINNENIQLGLSPTTDNTSIGRVSNTSKPLAKQCDETKRIDAIPSDDEKDELSSCTDNSSVEDMLTSFKPVLHQHYKTNNVDTISLDDEKDVIKNKNIRLGLSSTTDAPSKEDILKICSSTENERDDNNSPNTPFLDDEKDIENIPFGSPLTTDELSKGCVLKTHGSSTNANETDLEIDLLHTPSPDVELIKGIEKSENTFYRENSPRYTCPFYANIDEKESNLNMKRFPYVSRTYSSSRKESLPVSSNIIGGDYHLLKNKAAESEISDDESEDGRKKTTKLQIEDDCCSDVFPLDNEGEIKDAASVISTGTNTSVSTLRESFKIPALKDKPPGCLIESGPIRTHWRTTGFYRNCPQTFITKHARLEKRSWANTGFVVAGLYAFGFFCLGYTLFSSAMVNPVIILAGLLLISLASLILFLIYSTEKNRSLYTLSSGERRKITFSNPFPAAL